MRRPASWPGWKTALKQKALEEIKKQNDRKPLAERLKPLEAEQKAIARGERSGCPCRRTTRTRSRTRSRPRSRPPRAIEAVKQKNLEVGRRPDGAGQAGAGTGWPTSCRRWTSGRNRRCSEVAKLRKQQDEIAKKAEQAAEQAHNADPKDPQGEGPDRPAADRGGPQAGRRRPGAGQAGRAQPGGPAGEGRERAEQRPQGPDGRPQARPGGVAAGRQASAGSGWSRR